jgi:hypothetical protein
MKGRVHQRSNSDYLYRSFSALTKQTKIVDLCEQLFAFRSLSHDDSCEVPYRCGTELGNGGTVAV